MFFRKLEELTRKISELTNSRSRSSNFGANFELVAYIKPDDRELVEFFKLNNPELAEFLETNVSGIVTVCKAHNSELVVFHNVTDPKLVKFVKTQVPGLADFLAAHVPDPSKFAQTNALILPNALKLSESATAELRTHRFGEFLESQAATGLSQRAVAKRIGTPAQYVSDMKRGRRPVSELVARRVAEVFGVSLEWLLGKLDSEMKPRTTATSPSDKMEYFGPGSESISIPLHSSPISGDPWSQASWDGSTIVLTGSAAAQARNGIRPYAMKVAFDEPAGRLRHGDMVLISQFPNPEAAVHVLEAVGERWLARRQGTRFRALSVATLPTSRPLQIGHVLGIIWGAV